MLYGQQENVWTLRRCIDYALKQNIQVRKGELTTQRAQLSFSQARAQRYPSLNGSVSQNFYWDKGNATGQSGYTGNSNSSYSVYSGVELFNGFRTSNQIRQTSLGIESSAYALEATRESISLNILDAYLQVLYAEEKVSNSLKQIGTTEEQLRLAGERLSLKIISAADYAQVKSQLSSEKLTLANARSQLSIDRIILMQLMELPADTEFSIAKPDLTLLLSDQRISSAGKVYETALAIKPQIKYADFNKKIAGLDRKIAEAGYFPSLTASAGLSSGYSTVTEGNYFNQINQGIHPSVGLTLSIPIYQRREVKTNIESARLNYNEAELNETDTKNQLRKSIEQACSDVLSAQSEYTASIENYDAMKESSALSEEKFVQGIINSVDYLVSKTNLIVAESQLLQSKYNLIFSYKVLDFYEGLPLSL